MREASGNLRQVLDAGGFTRAWVTDLIYDDVRRLADLPLQSPSFTWDGSNQIQGSGSCEIVWADMFGRGIVPSQIGDLFSPFGAELQVDMLITAGEFSERIPMGRFVLESVPEGAEYSIPGAAGGLPVTLESRISLDLKDLMLRVQRNRFAFPKSPDSTSMWQEAFNLTGLATVRNIDDVVVSTSVTYDEDRLKGLDDLFNVADAWPQLTPSGQLTTRPKTWPSTPVDEFGGVVSASRSLESEKVYNRVVVEGKSPTGAVIRVIRGVDNGFLRVQNSDGSRSPFGVSTYFYQSDFLTTTEQCRTTADGLLERVSRLQSVTRRVVEPLMPLREVGDVVLLEGAATRILSVRHDLATTTSVVEVRP